MSGRIATGAVMVLALAGPARSQVPAGPHFGVNTHTTDIQQHPLVAADTAGNFIVVWEAFGGQDGSGGGVFGRRYDAAGTALEAVEFQVNGYTTLNQVFPGVAVDSTRIVAAWASNGQDGSDFGVVGRLFDAITGTGGPEFAVNTYTTGRQWRPSVALDGSGNFVVVWDSLTAGGGYDVFGRRFSASGAALDSEFRINSTTAGNQYVSRVALHADGRFVVVWESAGQDGDGFGIFGQRFDADGLAAGAEFQVNTYTTGAQRRPSVAPEDAGGFVAVWDSGNQDGSSDGVFGRRYDAAGAPQGGELRVNSYTTGAQSDARVASAADGEFVVVWQSNGQDGSGLGIFGRRYDRLGAQGPESLLNDYTFSAQFFPAVASAANGDFVAVWGGVGPHDLAPGGVYARRFSPEVIFRDGFDAP
jgi:hypothetical protein